MDNENKVLDDRFDDRVAGVPCAGHVAFAAYCDAKDIEGIAHTGRPIPAWSNLPEHIRAAWVAGVAAAVANKIAAGELMPLQVVVAPSSHAG